MITLNKYEGKNLEELWNQCLKELDVTKEDVYFKEDSNESGLFKSKKYTLEVVTKQQIKDYIEEFINNLGKLMNLEINFEMRINEHINILLTSDNNNILIGKDGKNLNAIQVLLNQAVNGNHFFDFLIIVDVSNYKEKKLKSLEYQVRKICKEVLSSKVDVKLDPMNSYERRLVHNIVSEYENLVSSSTGEGKERFTTIKYKD